MLTEIRVRVYTMSLNNLGGGGAGSVGILLRNTNKLMVT